MEEFQDIEEMRMLWEEKMYQEELEWKALGNKFEACRKALGLTATATAKLLGVSTGSLRKFELGQPVFVRKSITKSYRYLLLLIVQKLPEGSEWRNNMESMLGQENIFEGITVGYCLQ